MISAINGPAIGLGCDIAFTGDIRIASQSARFASSFINVGLIPGDGGAWILPRAVGQSKAAELIFTGDTIGADEARACGLVSQVVPDDALLDIALALARKIASRPAKILRLGKRLLREGQQQRLSDVLELSAAFQALAHETADHREAVEAFVAKRPPVFTGR
jgi:enoyl-CoA hydratase/carnithine racemase